MSLNIAFTICSNNYLPQAITLKDSFLNHNPDFKFYIVLVDEKHPDVNYKLLEPAELILASDISLYDLDELLSRYNIIELNTSIKASCFKHLISIHNDAELMYYLDPDLYFYAPLKASNLLLKSNNSAVLTPHILEIIPRDNHFPDENTFLNFGTYNLGFLGLNVKDEAAIKLLDWWEERTLNHGQIDLSHGYFVDQLWMNLAPIIFERVAVLKDYGYNMGPWNLHERNVTKVDSNGVLINDEAPLVFYHYSKLSDNEDEVSRVYNRYQLSDLKLLQTLYKEYKALMVKNEYHNYKGLKIAYDIKPVEVKNEEFTFSQRVKIFIKKVLFIK